MPFIPCSVVTTVEGPQRLVAHRARVLEGSAAPARGPARAPCWWVVVPFAVLTIVVTPRIPTSRTTAAIMTSTMVKPSSCAGRPGQNHATRSIVHAGLQVRRWLRTGSSPTSSRAGRASRSPGAVVAARCAAGAGANERRAGRLGDQEEAALISARDDVAGHRRRRVHLAGAATMSRPVGPSSASAWIPCSPAPTSSRPRSGCNQLARARLRAGVLRLLALDAPRKAGSAIAARIPMIRMTTRTRSG